MEGDGGLQAGGSPGHLNVLLWWGSSTGWAGQRWHPSAYTDPSERAKLLRGSTSAPFPVGLGALLRAVRGLRGGLGGWWSTRKGCGMCSTSVI